MRPVVGHSSGILVGEVFPANESFGMHTGYRNLCRRGAAQGGIKAPAERWDSTDLGIVRPPALAFSHHICYAIIMAKRDPASRYVWSTRWFNRTSMSIAAQYRIHATEFLSLACKMNDSCRTSEVIDEALYWFNMAERGESQISANLPDIVPPARPRGGNGQLP